MLPSRRVGVAPRRRLVAALVVPVGVLALLALGVAAPPSTPVLGVGTAAAAEPTAVDLGTLGGATSKAVALNGVGQVAGDSETDRGATHAFRWAKGHMKDLGTLGGRDSHAVAINAAGDIAGYAQTSTGAWRAVLWPSPGDRKNLGTLGGGYSRAADLNDQRQVVGTAERADGTRVAFRWTPAGGMQDLGTLGGTASSAQSINALGQVAGSSELADGNSHAFLWAAGTGMQDLGTLGGRNSSAVAINALGQVAGESQTDPEAPFTDAFRWTPEQGMQLLPSGYYYPQVHAIGDAGDVVGSGLGGPYHGSSYALRWALSGPVALEQPCSLDAYPCDSTVATDVNADGVTVGSITVVGGVAAARWSADGQIQYLPGLGGAVSHGVAINASGQVAGDSWTAGGATHAVLWR
jgi:probable HAF family extracellular repeat protein